MLRIKTGNRKSTAVSHRGAEHTDTFFSRKRQNLSWLKACFAALLSASTLAVFAIMAALLKGGTLMADDTDRGPTDAIVRLFLAQPVRAEWFTTEFIAAVPPPRVQSIIEGLTTDFGGFVEVQLDGREGVVRLERAIVSVEISLDGTGRISGLLFQPPQPIGTSTGDIAEALVDAALGGVAVLAAELRPDGTWVVLAENSAREPMAVGSAFKLAVLQAYEDAVASGKLNRADVVELRVDDRSLPSGVLQTMQPGVPVTLEALAGLMIQHSDNTATDALIRVLGRGVIEDVSPRNQPFLTTGEFFKLIARQGDAHRSSFVAGGLDQRRAILANLAETPLPDTSDIGQRATWSEVEWYFTAEELCNLLSSLKEAPALNGLPDPLVATDGWQNVRYKGGSEFGVLNLSAAGTTPDGRDVCAVFSTNAKDAVTAERFALLFGSLFRSMGKPNQ